MRLAEAWRVALDALRANRLRSGLTMLGMVIGVAAVVVLVALGTGTKNEVEAQVEGLGANLMFVVPGKVDFGSAPTSSPPDSIDLNTFGRTICVGDRVGVTMTSGEAVRAGTASAFTTVVWVLE